MEKLRAFWDNVVDSLWFVPLLITAGCAGLATLLITQDDAISSVVDSDLWFIFAGTADGAQGVLQAISTSIMTVTGVVFSITIVTLQLASSQFTPRVLRQFMADRGNQLVLGVFIGTFTYSLLVQRTIREGDNGDEFVPGMAVTAAVFLALTSIGFLIYFVNHAARSVQAAVVIQAAFEDCIGAIDTVFPARKGDVTEPPIERAEHEMRAAEEDFRAVHAPESGYVQAVDSGKLMRLAETHQLVIRTEFEIGEFLLPGQTLYSVWPGADLRDELIGQMCDAVVLGFERTSYQDVKHGVVELMDITVKAMSPSTNDPTTAINAIDRATALLLELSWRRRGDRIERDHAGRPLLIMRRPRLEDTIDLFFHQVRFHAAKDPTVAIKLIQSLAELTTLGPPESRNVFRTHIENVIATAKREIDGSVDLQRVGEAESAALGRIAAAALEDRDRAAREFRLDHERRAAAD